MAEVNPALEGTQLSTPGPVERGSGDWLIEELHDGVVQSLWYLCIELAALRRDISPSEEEQQRHLEMLGQVAQDAYHELRVALKRGHTSCEPDNNLRDVIQERSLAFEKLTGVQVSLVFQGEGFPVDPWKVHHLAAILQEALWNAWRHGRTQKVHVELTINQDAGVLKVADSGAGFAPDAPGDGHYGLAAMEKRAYALGGVLRIHSRPGSGTQVVLDFPRESTSA